MQVPDLYLSLFRTFSLRCREDEFGGLCFSSSFSLQPCPRSSAYSKTLFPSGSIFLDSAAKNLSASTLYVLSIPCILGFNILSGIQPLGAGSNIMDLEDFLVSNNILPLGSVIYLMFCTHKNGWGWNNFIQEANAGNGLKFPQFIRKYMTYILPWIVVIIYLKGYYDKFSSQSNVVFGVWMAVAFAFLLLVFSVTRKQKQTKL